MITWPFSITISLFFSHKFLIYLRFGSKDSALLDLLSFNNWQIPYICVCVFFWEYASTSAYRNFLILPKLRKPFLIKLIGQKLGSGPENFFADLHIEIYNNIHIYIRLWVHFCQYVSTRAYRNVFILSQRSLSKYNCLVRY